MKKRNKSYPPETGKDDSDTQSAMNYAIQNGAKRITILGATGNRVDHLMANFGLLVLAKNQGVEVILADQYNYMKLVSDGEIIKSQNSLESIYHFSIRRRCYRTDAGGI